MYPMFMIVVGYLSFLSIDIVGGRQARLFFLQGLRCKFEEKKITLWACRPMGERPGYIFEIFENRHIFLKFYFFLNIKKKKPLR